MHPQERWSTLFLWWVTHALVGGVVRVVFEAELIAITRSPRFALGTADVEWLLQSGTIRHTISKVLLLLIFENDHCECLPVAWPGSSYAVL